MQKITSLKRRLNIAVIFIALSLALLPTCSPETPPPGGPKIIIRYSGETIDHIGESKPAPGYVYLMLTLDIQNTGYSEFSTNPERFFVTVNHITYDVALVTFPEEMRGFGITNGQQMKSKLAFEVPETVSMWGYEPGYTAFPARLNIEWLKEQAG
jgi:hypothetical protein